MPGTITQTLPRFDWIDLFVIFIQIISGLVNYSFYFLRPEEKEFLQNVSALHSKFYKMYAFPAIEKFNYKVRHVPFLKEAIKDEKNLSNNIRKVVNEKIERRERKLKNHK